MIEKNITYGKIWKIAWPIILGGLAQNVVAVTDTAFLGRVGDIALGAAAIGGIFYLAVAMLGWGFGIGTQIIVARRFGEGRTKEIGEVIVHSLYFLIPSALLLFLILKNFSPLMLGYLVQSENILSASLDYLSYRSFGILFAFINMAFRAFYIGITRTAIITWSTAIMALVNVFFDYVLVFGKMGFPEMGIEGAAIASVIAELVTTICFILYTNGNSCFRKYQLFNFRSFRKELYFRIIRVASPVMFQNFFSLSVWFLFFILVEGLGERSLAISNIIRSIYMLMMLPTWGFASATNTLVSSVIGQGRKEEVLRLIGKVVLLNLLSVSLFVVLNLIFPEQILLLYTDDLSMVKDALPVLYVVSLSSLFITVGFVLFNGVSGTGKTNISLVLELGILVVYLVYAYSIVNFFNGTVVHMWTSELVYGILLSVLSYFYLKSERWHETKI